MIDPGQEGPSHYRDVAVLAWRTMADDMLAASLSVSSGTVSAALLTDGRFASTLDLPFDSGSPSAWVQQSFAAPVQIRSVVVGMPGARGFAAPMPPLLRLEASDDGVEFRKVVDMPATRSPVRSASFAPVAARYFRIVLSPAPFGTGASPIAPGVILPNFGPRPPNRYSISEFTLDAASRVHRSKKKPALRPRRIIMPSRRQERL